jgi:RimJ/RimL family protein N-acetyltransferase
MNEPLEVELRDGTPVSIRPIRPSDRERLAEGFAALSERSRYLRFHTSMPKLSDAQLRYLSEVDQHDHVALVAGRRDDPEGPGLGVARYVRLADDPSIAEAAVTVADQWQGRGLGTLLLLALAREALGKGVRTFRNYVLAENTGMIKLFEQLGAEREPDEPGVYVIDFELPADPDDLPNTPAARVFRAVAQGLPARLDPAPRPVWHERGPLREWLDEHLGSRS